MTYRANQRTIQERRAEDDYRAAVEQLRADADYIAMLSGIELDEEMEETE